MSGDNRFYTIKNEVKAVLTVKKSKFISTLAPRDNATCARDFIDRIKEEFPDASHHVYAYRLYNDNNTIERFSDAGEPSGTAGKPMLRALQTGNVCNVVIVATRYFGGTKLGIGGLSRAYRQCASSALEKAVITIKEPFVSYLFTTFHDQLGSIIRLLETNEGKIDNIYYGNVINVSATFPERMEKDLLQRFVSTSRGRGNYRKLSID